MKATAIIVAAGSGKRLGADQPKALVDLCGVPLVIHSLRAMLAAEGISAVVVAVPGNARSLFAKTVDLHGPWRCPISLVAGGIERQDSVRAGLAEVGDSDLVAVHDAARPFVAPEVVQRALEVAERHDAAIVAVPASDTVKEIHPDGWIESTPPRERLWLAQTPQVFRTDILRHAHERGLAKGIAASDDSVLVERVGVRVHVVTGDDDNRKITTPEDLRWAEWHLSSKNRVP